MTLVQTELKSIKIGIPHDDYSAMQGPCPDGFHVPLNTEWQAVYDVWTSLGGGSSDGTNFAIALKLPFAGYRGYDDADVYRVGSNGYYWSSTPNDANNAYRLGFGSSGISPQSGGRRSYGLSVRCFKNSPVIPTSSWEKLYGTSIEAGGIFWSSSDGFISLSSNGTDWITIADKNLGATKVWNNKYALTDANCGNVFQWGNNYTFPGTKSSTSITTSSTQVNVNGYGPGNYYSSSTWITSNPRNSTANTNLRGGVTGIVQKTDTDIKKVYLGSTQVRPSGWKPGANTIAYYPLETDFNDASGNSRNLANTNAAITTLNGVSCAYYNGNSYSSYSGYSLTRGARTISAWANGISLADSNVIHIAKFGSSYRGSLSIAYYSNYILVADSTGADTGAYTGTANTRYYIVATQEGNTVKCYINGQLWNTNTSRPNYDYTPDGWTLGCRINYYNKLNGYLSKVILEDKTRTAQEISDYYNQTKADYGL